MTSARIVALELRGSLVMPSFRLGLEAQPRCFPGTTARTRIRGLPGAGEGHRVGEVVLVSGEVEAVHLGTRLAETLEDLLPVPGYSPGEVRLAHAVQIVDAPFQLVQSSHRRLAIPSKLTVGVAVVGFALARGREEFLPMGCRAGSFLGFPRAIRRNLEAQRLCKAGV
jgi:hypothetical protein